MANRVFITSLSIVLLFLIESYNLLFAQVFENKTSKIPNTELDTLIMNQLEFGFSVPDSSIIANITYIDEKGFVAFDKNGNELFIIFPFDNGPDYISEGMLRIIENGLIGFASELGEIVIKPVFDAVYPFRNGLAAFCENCITIHEGEHTIWDKGKWGFIDRNGDVVIPPSFDKIISDFETGHAAVEKDGVGFTINKEGKKIAVSEMNYIEWIRLFGEALWLLNKTKFDDSITINIDWISKLEGYNFTSEVSIMQVDIRPRHDDKYLARYYFIPWQNFSCRAIDVNQIIQVPLHELYTVTDFAIILRSFSGANLSVDYNNLLNEFTLEFNKLIEYENQQQRCDEELNIPESVQVLSTGVFQNYVDLQVAIPGSLMPDNQAWLDVAKNKMLRLSLVPDIGPIKAQWIKQIESFSDTYYSSVENELQGLFTGAIEMAIQFPDERSKIFNDTKASLRSLFSAANSYVNFLYDEYESRLKRWLVIEYKIVDPSIEGTFPGYHPKTTPNTVLDYMPSLVDEIAALPNTSVENIIPLVDLFNKYQNEAGANPGEWEEGNMILGARDREYRPSAAELMLCEVGKRIQSIINSSPKDKIDSLLQAEKIAIPNPEFHKFTFIHMDVMGSGRFFYVDAIEKSKLDF